MIQQQYSKMLDQLTLYMQQRAQEAEQKFEKEHSSFLIYNILEMREYSRMIFSLIYYILEDMKVMFLIENIFKENLKI